MSTSERSSYLRRTLFADAVLSGAAGLLMALGAGPLEERLEVPQALLRYAGWSCVAFAALLVTLARSTALPRGAVVGVVALNAAWVLASVLVLFVGGFRPNPLGYAFVLVQAVAVAVLAELQAVGLRRASQALE